ncbi:MAG: hypothetical protein OXT09_06620 [Myxococcales bacterium]|nr:hypothetical protein [Myxococcales bacterium]
MGGRRSGSSARTTEDNSGLIDLRSIEQRLDPNGDPVSGLQRKATIGRLDAPSTPKLEPVRPVNWIAIAMVVCGAMLAIAVVALALILKERQTGAPAPAVAPSAHAVVEPPTTPPPSAPAQQPAPTPAKSAGEPAARPTPEPEPSGTRPANVEEPQQKKKRRVRRKLPAKPDRASILAGMKRVQSRIRACARGQGGVAHIAMVIDGPRGRVRSAKATGVPGAVARCVNRAAKRARFKPFADKRFQIRYPIRL